MNIRGHGVDPGPARLPITVLVADDDEDMRMLVRVTLERSGFEVLEDAIDGPDALAAVAKLEAPPVPTVMVLDNQMPGLTGLEVAEHVLASIPGQRIILFSAYLDPEVRQHAKDIGVSVTIAKTEVYRLPAVIAALAAEP